MSFLDETAFQYFPGKIWITEPLGRIALRHFIESHKNPRPEIKAVFNKIALAEIEGDKELKGRLKQNNLFYFNPCVLLDGKGRSYENVTGFTGLMVLDFDHIENAEEFRDSIFHRLKSVVAAYVSPSQKGVKLIIRMPVVKTVDEFKEYFYGISVFMERFPGFDGTTQNPVLPLFLSWDEGILYREDAKEWDMKGTKLTEFPSEVDEDFEPLENASELDTRAAYRKLKNILAKSEAEQNGHGNVRAAGLLAGGYAAMGYFTIPEAEEFICNTIEEIPYLQSNLSGYCKTAKQMIQRGASRPLKV